MSSPQHEPTMEEILASIRKIISEDAPESSAAPAAPEPPAPVSFQAAPEPQHDILELTQEFVEQPRPVAPTPMPVAEPSKPENDVVFETVVHRDEPPVNPVHNDIFSDTTRKAIDDTFANIPDEPDDAPPAPHAVPSMAPVDGASVESVFERAVRESFDPVLSKYLADNSGAVIERMKPLIREWMDEHFPPLLEGAVRAEVERVVKARGAKR